MKRRTELRGRAARLARLLPGQSRAARTPFVLLVVVLLGGGLIGLLMLNSALNEGSFEMSKLKKQTTDLTDEEQKLQREVNGYAQPDALEQRARELGMVPGGPPAFIAPDGTVHGDPGDPAPTPSPALSPTPSGTPGPTPSSSSSTHPSPAGSAPPQPGRAASTTATTEPAG